MKHKCEAFHERNEWWLLCFCLACGKRMDILFVFMCLEGGSYVWNECLLDNILSYFCIIISIPTLYLKVSEIKCNIIIPYFDELDIVIYDRYGLVACFCCRLFFVKNIRIYIIIKLVHPKWHCIINQINKSNMLH